MTITSFENYSDSVREKFPTLGNIMWYSVSEPKIKYDDLATKFTNLGLSHDYLPPRTRGVDAFRNACKAAQKRRVKDGTIVENYLLREVVAEDDRVVEHIMCERVDSKGEQLSYERVGKAIYYRPQDNAPHGRVVTLNEAPFYDQRVTDLVNEINAAIERDWDDRVVYLHANAIRGIINRILLDCSTIRVRPSGGVYFAPEAYNDKIKKLTLLLNDLGGECHMHIVPLVDVQDQRQMLLGAFENEAVKEMERAMDDIAEMLKSGKKISVTAADVYVSQHARLVSKAKEYSELLGSQVERVEQNLNFFKQQVNSFVARVE